MQAIGRWVGEPKKVALLLLAAGLAAVAALGVAASAASAATFSNSAGITINDAVADCSTPGTATPYPSGIEVSGLGDSVSDVNVTLTGLSHSFPDDVGVLLVGPEGQTTILMTDVGTGIPASGVDLTFDDAASGTLPDQGALLSGTYQPTRGTVHTNNCQVPSSFPAPAPEGPYGSSLSVFNDSDPNGTWQLYVIDDTRGDTGPITGWSLEISTTTAEDTTAPTVTDTTPDGTASKTANVTATFDEEVQNVTSSTFFLERRISVKKNAPPKFERVDATVSLINGSYVLDPVQDLPKGDYRATITTAVTDVAGNELAANEVWTFKVAK